MPAVGMGPMVSFRSQAPPMQTGNIAMLNVSVQNNVANGSICHVSSVLRLHVFNALFRDVMSPAIIDGNDSSRITSIFQISDVVTISLSNIVVSEIQGRMSAVMLVRADQVTIRNFLLAGSMLAHHSFAFCQLDSVAVFRLLSSTFDSNTCNNCSSSVFFLHDVGLADLTSLAFTNNTCTNCGGGGALSLTFSNVVTTLASSNVSFMNNRAQRGGALAIFDHTTSLDFWRPSLSRTLANMTFVGNFASQAGGAVYWYSALKFTLPPGIQFQLQDQPANVLLQGCLFKANEAPEGAAVAMEHVNVVATSCSFEGNAATATGGGVWLSRSSGVFSQCIWKGNLVVATSANTAGAEHGGAAVHATDCLASGVSIVASDFMNNSVTGNTASGGGVHTVRCAVRLADSIMERNHAETGYGGAVACTDGELLHIQATTVRGNSAAVGGGGIWVRNTDVTSRGWSCSENAVTAWGKDGLGGGCLAAMGSTVNIDSHTVFADNRVVAVTGVGGATFVDCTSALSVAESSIIANGSAAIGSNIYVECFEIPGAPSRHIPKQIRSSPTINSGTQQLELVGEPAMLINSLPAAEPVVMFRLLDAFGSHRWEDNATLCTVSAVGANSSQTATMLSSTRFVAINGYVELHPVSVLANETDSAVVVSVKCTTPAAVDLSATVTVALVLPEVHLIPPTPPTKVVTQQPFEIHLRIRSNASLPRDVIALTCVVECEDAIAMSGTKATSSNDYVVFDGAAITGVIGETYQLHIDCTLGSIELPPPPPIEVHIDTCPRGAEPDVSNTQCRQCPLNAYSEGGRTKCRRCPSRGAVWFSRRIQFQLQDQPANVLLQGCLFKANEAPEGAAVAMEHVNVVATSCSFEGNAATATGGGVWLSRSSGVFSQCIWKGNLVVATSANTAGAEHGGAAVHATDCLASGVSIVASDFMNNSVTGNTASGGGVHTVRCAVRLADSIMERNHAETGYGGAVACTDGELLHIQATTVRGNSAAVGGGGIWVRNTDVTSRGWSCSENAVTAWGKDGLGGGCLAAMGSTVNIDSHTVFADNRVVAVTGVGGATFVDCTSALSVAESSIIANGSAAIGSNIYVECFEIPGAPSRHIPKQIRSSPTINSGTQQLELVGEPAMLINSLPAAEPVVMFRLLDAFGSHRWEDNATLCTVSAVGANSSQTATMLSSTRFVAINGYVELHPVSVLAKETDSAVVVSVKCTTPAAVDLSATVTVALVLPEVHLIPPTPPTKVVTQQPFEIHLRIRSNASLPRDVIALTCVVECEDAIAMSGTKATSSNDYVVFDGAAITGVIGETYQLHIDCTLGSIELPPPPPIEVHIDTCPRGAEPDVSNTQCRQCPLNAYSEGGRTKCRRCPSRGAVCSAGVITLERGYYPADTRFLSTPPSEFLGGNASSQGVVMDEAVVLYPCWNGEACDANSANQTYGCGIGYTGPLCGVCDSNANFVRSGNVCTACWPQSLNVMVLLLFLAVLIIGLIYVAVFQSVKKASPRKIVLRILLTYIQVLSSLGLFQAHATQTFRDIFGVSEAIGGSFVSWPPLQCVLGLSYYMKFTVNIGLPFLMVPLSIGLAGITLVVRAACASERWRRSMAGRVAHRCCSRRRPQPPKTLVNTVSGQQHNHPCAEFRQYVRNKAYLAPAVFVLFLSYNVLSTTAATMFKCRPETIDGQRFLEADLSVPCYDTSHFSGMVAAGCIGLAFNVGMPVLLWWFLRRNKHRLYDSKIFRRFGFLYQGYSVSRGRYAWESVVLLRKFIIVMVGSTVEDPWYQAIAGISIVGVALVLQTIFRPYDTRLYNQLETAVLSVVATTQVVSLVYLRSETVPMTPNERLRVDVVVTVLLVLLNGGMLAILVYCIMKRMRCFHRCCGSAREIASSNRMSNVAAAVAAMRGGVKGVPMKWNPVRQRNHSKAAAQPW